MGLEVTTDIEGLVASNPTGLDSTTQGNDHLQLIKNVLKITFPGAGGQGFAGVITANEDELNYSVGLSGNIQAQFDNVDIKIDADILAEATAREDADTALGIRIDDEAATRLAADDALSVDITNETNARISADGQLQNNIDQEAIDRDTVDIALQDQIDAIVNNPNVPSGSKMIFVQGSAPVGWTADESAGNNRMLRVVTVGTGGGFGGAISPILLTDTTSPHAHTTGTLGLTVAQMPAHTHSTQIKQTSQAIAAGAENGPNDTYSAQVSTSAGSGDGHNHGNTSSNSTAVSIQPRYLDTMVAQKD